MAAALIFTTLIGALCLFQLALALGAPWGRFAWGGQHAGRLPTGLRIGSAVGILVYAAFAMIALDRAGAIDVLPAAVSQVGMWVVFGILVLGTGMNLISRSKLERTVMTPVALILAVLALLVALLAPASSPGGDPAPDSAAQFGTFTVIGDEHGAVWCADAVMESYPPQCHGTDLIDWDWRTVASYEEANGVRWGEYDLKIIPAGDRVRAIVAEPVAPAAGGDDPAAGDADPPTDLGGPSVTWLEPGEVFELVTYGSSGCPGEVTDVAAARADQVVLRFEPSGGEVCTADYGPTAHRIDLPAEVIEQPVTVFLDIVENDSVVTFALE